MHFKFKITGHCHLLLHQIPLWKGLFTRSLSPNKIRKSTVLLKDLNDHYTNSTTLMLTHFNLMQCWASLLKNWTNIHISFIWKFYIVLIIYERRKRSIHVHVRQLAIDLPSDLLRGSLVSKVGEVSPSSLAVKKSAIGIYIHKIDICILIYVRHKNKVNVNREIPKSLSLLHG